MKKQFIIVCLVFSFFLTLLHPISDAADLILNNTPTQVCFSPKGGCTETIINQINNAKSEILVQACSVSKESGQIMG
jgi:hypothetical protein